MAATVTLVSALAAGVTVVSLALAAIALLAWQRERRARFLVLALAFAVFLAKSAYFAYALFARAPLDGVLVAATAGDALLLLLVYAAAAR